uniref:Uncharacterized protein n=1 Tax=Romanomermis culicivorax TaxID=13658 RepID=A0A915K3D7_ROMCU
MALSRGSIKAKLRSTTRLLDHLKCKHIMEYNGIEEKKAEEALALSDKKQQAEGICNSKDANEEQSKIDNIFKTTIKYNDSKAIFGRPLFLVGSKRNLKQNLRAIGYNTMLLKDFVAQENDDLSSNSYNSANDETDSNKCDC